MSYHIVYVIEGREEPQDGDHLATASGWDALGTWILDHADDYPEAAHLAEHGEAYPAEALADLEAELVRITGEDDGPEGHVLSVAKTLLQAVRDRPARTVGLIVTDGSDGAGEDEDEEE